MGHPCSNLKSKVVQSSLYDEHIKINHEPIYDKHLFFKFWVMSGMVLWGVDMDSNRIFKLQKKVLQIISGV